MISDELLPLLFLYPPRPAAQSVMCELRRPDSFVSFGDKIFSSGGNNLNAVLFMLQFMCRFQFFSFAAFIL